MEDSLAHRLRIVFPQGVDWEPDEGALESDDQAHRLSVAFSKLRDMVRIEPWGKSGFVNEFVLTDPVAPTFEDWIRRMDNQSKIDWIRQSNSLYVALWFKVSRVADLYVHHFNHWRPRGDTGYLDADTAIKPDEHWQSVVGAAEISLGAVGFNLAPSSLLHEIVPFVLTWGGDAIAEDDPRWDDPDFEPPPIKACVYDCLFGDQ